MAICGHCRKCEGQSSNRAALSTRVNCRSRMMTSPFTMTVSTSMLRPRWMTASTMETSGRDRALRCCASPTVPYRPVYLALTSRYGPRTSSCRPRLRSPSAARCQRVLAKPRYRSNERQQALRRLGGNLFDFTLRKATAAHQWDDVFEDMAITVPAKLG
jgi:hypothetical protein